MQTTVVCHDCDLLLENSHILEGKSSYCPRCHSKIPNSNPLSVERVLMFSLGSLIIYLPAMFSPIMDLNSYGFTSEGNIFHGVTMTFQQGFYLMAGVILLTSMIIPLALPLLLFLTSAFMMSQRYLNLQIKMLRTYQRLREWGMSDIYLLGILVAIIKISPSAEIKYQIGMLCFFCLVVFNLLAANAFHKSVFWNRIGEQSGVKPDLDIHKLLKGKSVKTAKEAGIQQCEQCHFLVYQEDGLLSCPRCHSKLHFRKPNSINRTWAFLIAAMIFFLPANLLPIMQVTSFKDGIERSTILGGIMYFYENKEYLVGLIISVASILVPVYKIIGLLVVLISVKCNFSSVDCKWRHGLKYKMTMFRWIKFIGRWSMLDIFVIAIMSVFVNLGKLSTSVAAPAALYFCIVVIATMFATDAFDLRLLWDEDHT